MADVKHLKGCPGEGEVELYIFQFKWVKRKDFTSQFGLRKSFKRHICYKSVRAA